MDSQNPPELLSLYQVETIRDSSLHAFAYWNEYDAGYPFAQRISSRVIAFS
jgi:hypothetical protein